MTDVLEMTTTCILDIHMPSFKDMGSTGKLHAMECREEALQKRSRASLAQLSTSGLAVGFSRTMHGSHDDL
jgi:hypothetical protein